MYILIIFTFFPYLAKQKYTVGWCTVHGLPNSCFCAAEYVKDHYSDALMAYLFGFLSHYCLDKYVHALVYRDTKNISTHTYLEQALDVMYADQYFHMDARNVNRQKELLRLITDADEINAFHKYMAAKIYDGYKLPPRTLERCYKWWSCAMRSTFRPSRLRRFWLRFINVFLSFDIYAFIYKKKEEVEGLHNYREYFDAIDKATAESARYMELVFEYVNGKTA